MTQSRLWKLSRYGNGGKTNRVFPPLPQRLENSPKNVGFPTVSTASTTTPNRLRNSKRENQLFPQYTRTLPLHFQVEFANEKWKMESGKCSFLLFDLPGPASPSYRPLTVRFRTNPQSPLAFTSMLPTVFLAITIFA